MLWSSNRSLELFDRIRYNRHVALNCFVPLYGLQYQATSVTNLPSLLTAYDWLVTLIIRLTVSVTVTRYTSTLSVSLSDRRSRSSIVPKQINILSSLFFRHALIPPFLFLCQLTISSPVVSNGYTLKCSRPYRSNPQFLCFFCHSGTLAFRTERQSARMSKLNKGGLHQYNAKRFDRLICATTRKSVGLKGLTYQFYFSFIFLYLLNLSQAVSVLAWF